MNSKKLIALALSLAAACWLGAALAKDSASQPAGKTQAAAPKPEAAKAAPVQQMSEKEMMEAWAKASAPNDHHKNLQKLVGTWSVKTRWWAAPGAPPQESTGTSKFTSLYDGRFVQESVDGHMGDQPFQGMGMFGYDNAKKKHVSGWIDSMSTGFMMSEGTCDGACKVIKASGSYWDPMTGKKKTYRAVHRIASEKEMTYEMWDHGPDGKEFKSLEVNYTRQ